MLTVLIVFLIALSLVTMRYWKKAWDLERYVLTVAAVIAGLFFGFMTSMIIRDSSPSRVTYLETQNAEIVALLGSTETEGRFFLLSGHVDSQDYYKFYYLSSDGARIFMKLPKESVRIYEENRKNAYLTLIQKRQQNNISSLWVPLFLQDSRDFQYYAIHAPKGSIKAEIDFNLK